MNELSVYSNVLFIFFGFTVLLTPCLCVSVHFENKDGGFFIKQSPVRQHYGGPPSPATTLPPSPDAPGSGVAAATAGVPLSTDKFVVFQSSQPISVRASYGPFSTKQTVPARYVVPDPLPMNTSGPTIDLHDHSAHHLDISAHIVRNEIPRDSPVLRVLFHAGTDPGGRRQVLLARHHQKVCVVLRASMPGRTPPPTPLHAACSPDGEDGVCLAEVTVPSSWWPALPSPSKEGAAGKLIKTPPRLVQIAYSVLEPWPDEGEGCHPKVQIQPSVILGNVPLVPAKGTYKELRLTDAIGLLVPHPPLFPLSKMHLPVYVDRQKAKMLTAIVIRARVKSGVRILEAIPSGSPSWNITVELNPRHTSATVTLVRREPPDPDITDDAEYGTELFTWLIEITEDAIESYDGSKIVWTVRFEPHQDDSDTVDVHKTEGRKSTTWFEIQKDDIQAVVPISKNWEVMNTAVLTGLQVSQAMKVFIVSQAGKAADVTFQASCHSEDESVLKVSSSCGSVYVDGSEARGSINGSVIVKYGTYTGIAKFIVWMPEFPLELAVVDTRLSQLKSWRVPDYHPSTMKTRRKKRSYGWGMTAGNDDMGNVIDKPVCRLRYQQTSVDVYAHFFATDHESGRTTYLINRRTSLRITELVLPWLRVSDPRIASLHGRILQGRSMGRTEVQVLSPITSRVYGSKEVRVGNDKVALTKLSVDVVSGLQLNISPDSTVENVYVVETAITRKLTAQYQEGLLDIELEFSDGSKIPLRDISDTDYHLVVESLDPEIVAFAPIVASHHPRVIAVGEGSGDLLQVTLLLADECRSQGKPKGKSSSPLATAAAKITVDFSEGELQHRPDILQNDGGSFSGGKGREFVDMEDISGGSLKEGVHSQIPNVQARQYQGKGVPKKVNLNNSTPLEISMYVLLAAFCCAIVVFVVSCVVYASRFKPMEAGVIAGVRPLPEYPSNITMLHEKPLRMRPRDSTTNAHDWVWLGRATVDNSNRNSALLNNNDVRIITNPLNTNYCEPEDSLATCFSNPNHVELPSKSEIKPRVIDSTTYSRSKVDREIELGNAWSKPSAPPPLPPHGSPLMNATPSCALQDDDYRPPIPPHRNILNSTPNGGTPTPTEPTAPVPTRRHHVKSTKEKANNKRFSMENKSPHSSPPGRPEGIVMEDDDDGDDENAGNMFEFDDELQVNNKKEDKMEFIQYPRSPNANNNRNSGGVKQATVVENRMFNASEGASAEKPASDLGDDLQLDMDYDQIMHYFENLKESNA
nr:unnamed protein product [Callosobruchus chinensis]